MQGSMVGIFIVRLKMLLLGLEPGFDRIPLIGKRKGDQIFKLVIMQLINSVFFGFDMFFHF